MLALFYKLGNPLYLVLVSFIIFIFLLYSLLKETISFILTPRKISLFILVLALSSFIVTTVGFYLEEIPRPEELAQRPIEETTKIYDRSKVLLYKIYKEKNRTTIKLEDLPQHAIDATIAIEDSEFYSHKGFSIKGMVRAIKENIYKGKRTGGSTITQQLVKNALLTPEKTFTRKIKELILSVKVEQKYTKDEILEMYLNEVSYGGTAYGIQEAAILYFGKDAKDLNLGESTLLAGLIKSPTKYSPFGTNPEFATSRRREVLAAMIKNSLITVDQANGAIKEKVKFAHNKTDIKAPHFVMYIKERLAEEYSEELIEKGGLSVVTSVDYSIQAMVEEILRKEKTNLNRYGITNASVVVLDPKSGEILAMVGSVDYFDSQNDGNVNVALRPRQPGSSIKVVNYAYALSHGYTPASVLDDSPRAFRVSGMPPYFPKNYDGRYRGKISLRSALAESRNIPAVGLLADYGVGNMLKLGREMGITTWSRDSDYGLSLTLGGGEVKLIDLSLVYATIANEGVKPILTPILEITDSRNKAIYEVKEQSKENRILDPRVAFLITNILSDESARVPAFGTHSSLVIPGHSEVAVKTGTSNNLRDNITIGYTKDYLVAVWVGNNDNSPMSQVASGVTGAAPIWNKVMASLITNQASAQWEAPPGLSQIAICPLTGTLPCEGCPTKKEWFLEELTPMGACFLKNVAQNEVTQSQN